MRSSPSTISPPAAVSASRTFSTITGHHSWCATSSPKPASSQTCSRAPAPLSTSLYGASKLACEGFIAAYADGFGLNATVYRFVSILGPAYWHGHVRDFVDQLIEHPDHLHI